MNIKDLKVGDKVFIREDLTPGEYYGAALYESTMVQGWCKVWGILNKNGTFSVKTDNGNRWEFLYHYTPEMVDWEKTRGDGTFKEITQSGESGNETTKAISYDGREIIVKNNNEKNDVEKAVMLLMLKQHGFTYGDVKREVEKVRVKWIPKDGEDYYTVDGNCEIKYIHYIDTHYDRNRIAVNNCFKTKEEAEEKLEKIKEVLRGDYDGK